MKNQDILILSKNNNIEKTLTNHIDFKNFTIDSTDCCSTAVEMIKDKCYKAVIIVEDIDDIKPFAFIHNLNLMQIDVPCVIISANINADSVSLAYDLGAYDILSDNIDDKLIEIIKNI